MILTKAKVYYNAVSVARKHFVNWPELVTSALMGRTGVFKLRAGGTISCDAKTLLKKVVRIEHVWRLHGDTLSPVRFEDDSLVIPNYFGRDFRVPFKVDYITPPSFYLKVHYPFEVVDDVVLDIGAYLGDTPLLWLYKGARSVIAVKPVPLHFQYLKRNVAGLPVACINASLAVELPYVPELEGGMGYGPFIKHRNINTSNKLNVPVVQLVDLVKDYRPTLVKLDCESCEHFVLEQLSQLPTLGVRKIAIEFHENDTYQFSEELLSFRKDINGDFKVWSLRKGVHMLYITVHTQ